MIRRYIQVVRFEQDTIVKDGIAAHLQYDFHGASGRDDLYFNDLIERCHQAGDIFEDLWRGR